MKAAILSILSHVALLALYALGRHIALTLLLIGVGFVGVVVGERLLRRLSGSKAVPILLVAALLRLLMLPLPPSLSDDVQRYMWDGKVLSEGLNPYELPPESMELEALRDEQWDELSHRDVATVYPPVSEALFAAVSHLPGSIWIWKILLVSVDLASCLLILHLLNRRGVGSERLVWYAWNPLVTLEVAGMAHIDGLGVAAVLLAFVVLLPPMRRIGLGATFAAAAVLIKLVPVLAFPVWARMGQKSSRFLGVATLLVAVGLIPVVWSVGGVPPGLLKYGVSWEFNGPIFEPLWRWIDTTDFIDWVSQSLDQRKQSSGEHEFWNRFYPFNYPQLWAKLFLWAGLGISMLFAWREKDAAVAMRKVFGAVILFSATVYPWYLLWVLPWAAVTGGWPWLGLSALLMLSYIPQFSDVNLFPWVYLLIWIPFAVMLVLCRQKPLP